MKYGLKSYDIHWNMLETHLRVPLALAVYAMVPMYTNNGTCLA